MRLSAKAASRRASPEDLSRLFGQLATSARGGLPMADAIEILAQDDEAAASARALLAEMAARTRAGGSLSDAMRRSAGAFAPETVALVRKAEDTDCLAVVLDLLARDYEHGARFRNATRAALLWPSLAFVFFMLVLLAMAFFVVPAFENLFETFGADLPGPTRVLIASAHVLSRGWVVWLPLLILGYAVWRWRRGSWEWLQSHLDALTLRLPIVRKYFATTLASRLAALIAASADGAPLDEGLAHMVSTTANRATRATLNQLRQRLASGASIADAAAAMKDLPGRLRVAIELGSRSGRLGPAMQQALALYAEDSERRLVRLEQATLLTAYLAVGLLVAVLVLGMYLPIFKMGQAI